MLSLRHKGEDTKYWDILEFMYKNLCEEYCQIMLGDMSHQVDPYLWSPCQSECMLSFRQKCDMSNIKTF